MLPKALYIFILFTAVSCPIHSQQDTVLFRAMTYNVENLFDCRDDSLTNDEEFLPEATRHWTYHRYRRKLDAVARVITAVGGWSAPALVGLCEVENDSVLHNLTRHSALREADYRYLVTHSPDERGIDVALLYRRHLFKLLAWQAIPVKRPHPGSRPTRDILHASGLLLDGDTLDVFAVHFPSRSSGRKATEPYRLSAASALRHCIDSLQSVRRNPRILVMGDFNDYPHNRSIHHALRAEAPPLRTDSLHPHRLYHLLARKAESRKHFGSYKYQGTWELIDHILVSGNLLNDNASLHTNEARTDVFTAPFLLSEDERNGGQQPFRTYYGMKYLGGFSDHLPLFVEFQLVY